jgi:hypothetical protein
MQPLRAVVVNGRGGASEVEAVWPGIEVGAMVRASRAYATTRKSPRSGVACDGVAQAGDVTCYSEGSGHRGVRRDVMRDRQCCARVNRVRWRAALGIVSNVPWDAGGVSCSRYCSAVEIAVYERVWRGDRQWFHRVRQWGALSGDVISATVCTVRRSVPAISLAWWGMMRRAVCCGALLTVPPCLRQSEGTLSSAAGYAGPSAVSTYGGSSASQSNYSASSTNYPRTPPAHTYTSSSSPSNAYNPTSTPYSITSHSTSSSAFLHDTPAPGPMPLRPLYAYGASYEWDSQSGESTDE